MRETAHKKNKKQSTLCMLRKGWIQWRILTNIIGGAQIIHPKFIHFIIVTNTIKNEVYEEIW